MPEEMSAALIERALRMLGDRVAFRGVTARVYVFGAAMVIGYRSRGATDDVDAVFAPDTEVTEAAWEVATELGLRRSWLNNQASAYLSKHEDLEGRILLEGPGITVQVASARHLLALKVLASRPSQDTDDIAFLLRTTGIRTAEEVLSIIHALHEDAHVRPAARLLLDKLLIEVWGPHIPEP